MGSCSEGEEPFECQKRLAEKISNAANFSCAQEQSAKWVEFMQSLSEEQRTLIAVMQSQSITMDNPEHCSSEATEKEKYICIMKAEMDFTKEKICNIL